MAISNVFGNGVENGDTEFVRNKEEEVMINCSIRYATEARLTGNISGDRREDEQEGVIWCADTGF